MKTQTTQPEPFMVKINRQAAEAQRILAMSDAELEAHLAAENPDIRDLVGDDYPLLAATRAAARRDATRPADLSLLAIGMIVPRDCIGYLSQLTNGTRHASNDAARQLVRIGMQTGNPDLIERVAQFVHLRSGSGYAFDLDTVLRDELQIDTRDANSTNWSDAK